MRDDCLKSEESFVTWLFHTNFKLLINSSFGQSTLVVNLIQIIRNSDHFGIEEGDFDIKLLDLVVGAVFVSGNCISASRIDLDNPVRTAREDRVKHLPGSNKSVKLKFYAGRLKAFNDGKPEYRLHYWFIEKFVWCSSCALVQW